MVLRRRARTATSDGPEPFPGFSDVLLIGAGSRATVYRAREVATGWPVALKVLTAGDTSPRATETLERRLRALRAVSSHPNIVTLYRTFRTGDGRPVLVLELCSGTVADRDHGGRGLPVRRAVYVGIKIACALETAHGAGILHRDVTPRSILLTQAGEPALAGLGVEAASELSTPHRAPELLEGGRGSPATDVYGLASSLYQLITGRTAFRTYEGEPPAGVILRILRDPVRPLAGGEVSLELSDVVIRAMSKDPDARPSTAAQFAAELADVERRQGWPRTPYLGSGR